MSTTTLIDKSSSKRWLWLLVPAALAVGAYLWWQHEQQAVGEQGQHAKALAPAPGGMWPTAGPGSGEGGRYIPNGPVGDAKPADFAQEDWDALNKALEHDPNKVQERNRLVSYLRFQRAVSKWSEMKDGPNIAERQGLARELLGQLPSHVANGEVNAGEATLLLTAVANDLESDPSKRQAWVEAQRTQLLSTQSPEQTKALQEEKQKNEIFAAQQAEIVARYQKLPPASQDPAALEAQLQALREKVYGGSGH